MTRLIEYTTEWTDAEGNQHVLKYVAGTGPEHRDYGEEVNEFARAEIDAYNVACARGEARAVKTTTREVED